MTGQALTVPTVDLSPYLDGASTQTARRDVARALDRACSEVGFVQLIGHGIDPATQRGLAAAMDDFFGLPLEVKQRSLREKAANRGYTPPRTDSLSMSLGVAGSSSAKDFYEAFIVGTERSAYPDLDLPADSYADNAWPADVPSFRPSVERWFAAASRLSTTLLAAFTDALELPRGFFDHLVDHSINTFKMNSYSLPEDEVPLAGELTGMGAHTDFGILTVLWADQVPGLQVLGPDGRWHDVQPSDGALLVNLGDAMARWTNDRWLSTVHRVNPPVVDGRLTRRRSAAFFFDGNAEAVIETLPGCATPERPGYPPITVGAHIAAKLAGMKAGVVPPGAEREASRVVAAG